jgi:hypothetical protein
MYHSKREAIPNQHMRSTHNPEVVGSNPTPATNLEANPDVIEPNMTGNVSGAICGAVSFYSGVGYQ